MYYICAMEIDIEAFKRRQATIATAIAMVDYYNGSLEMNTLAIKRIYNDENQTVKLDLRNRKTVVIGDMDIDMLFNAINEWREEHQEEFQNILNSMQK